MKNVAISSTIESTRLARRLNTKDAVILGLGSMIGAGIFAAAGPATAAAGTGILFRKRAELLQKIRFASGFSFVALFLVGLVNLILKVAFGRARPHMTETFESLKFDPLNFHWYWHSFPSGHAQVVFVVATLMSIAWPRFKLFFLFSAFGIALTRVVIHQHFLSDIILGAAVGYLGTVGLFIYQKEKSKVAF